MLTSPLLLLTADANGATFAECRRGDRRVKSYPAAMTPACTHKPVSVLTRRVSAARTPDAKSWGHPALQGHLPSRLSQPPGLIACLFEQRRCGHGRHEGAVRVAVDVYAGLSGPECHGAYSVAALYPAFCAILRQRLRGYVVR